MGKRDPQVDLGLAISGATLPPGKTRTITEIAAFCGCSKQNIEQLENKALKKLRHKVLFRPDLRDALAEFLSPGVCHVCARDHQRRTNPPEI
jgi:SpoU rRNA methylase family enzyme